MIDTVCWFLFVALACIGFVHTAAWIAVRLSCKGNRIYKIVPIGGERAGDRMSLFYACLQWESNPSRESFILYDVGLDEAGARDCAVLAQSAGAAFIRSPSELDARLRSHLF